MASYHIYCYIVQAIYPKVQFVLNNTSKSKYNELSWRFRLGEQSLGVAVQAVNTSLELSGSSSELESNGTGPGFGLQVGDALDTGILERVLQSGVQVRDEFGDGSLVGDITRDTLGDLNRVGLREVSSGGGVVDTGGRLGRGGALGGVLHGLDRAHASVKLDSLALVVEVLSRRLGRSSEETSHHDGTGTKGKGLGDVTDVSNTTIGDSGDTESRSKLGDGVDSSTLGSADGHDLLGDADGPGSHTDSKGISASEDELSGLLSSDDVSGDDLEVGEGLLDPLDELDLEDRVSLGRVEDNDIETGLDEQLQSLLVRRSGSNGGTTVELLRRGDLGGKWVVLVLQQVRSSDEGHEVALSIDDGEFTLLGVSDNLVGLLEGDTGRSGDEVGGHDLSDGLVSLSELNISPSDDTEELSADLAGLYARSGVCSHWTGLSLTGDGDTAEAESGFDIVDTGR
jgi:hypothetical protein